MQRWNVWLKVENNFEIVRLVIGKQWPLAVFISSLAPIDWLFYQSITFFLTCGELPSVELLIDWCLNLIKLQFKEVTVTLPIDLPYEMINQLLGNTWHTFIRWPTDWLVVHTNRLTIQNPDGYVLDPLVNSTDRSLCLDTCQHAICCMINNDVTLTCYVCRMLVVHSCPIVQSYLLINQGVLTRWTDHSALWTIDR